MLKGMRLERAAFFVLFLNFGLKSESANPLKIRLQKYIADAGIASRRAGEKLILEGRVRVNGDIIRLLGTRIDPSRDVVKVDDRILRPEKKRYVALHKPRGYVSTRSDEKGRRILNDLLPAAWSHLHPVGRLDRESEGLIFLTNDGDFSLRVSHPRYRIPKKYLVTVEGRIDPRQIKVFIRGVWSQGERLKADDARVLSANNSSSLVEIVLSEGRNREVRRMFKSAGRKVERLKRIEIGPIKLGELPAGKWRTLSRAEIQSLVGSGKRSASALT